MHRHSSLRSLLGAFPLYQCWCLIPQCRQWRMQTVENADSGEAECHCFPLRLPLLSFISLKYLITWSECGSQSPYTLPDGSRLPEFSKNCVISTHVDRSPLTLSSSCFSNKLCVLSMPFRCLRTGISILRQIFKSHVVVRASCVRARMSRIHFIIYPKQSSVLCLKGRAESIPDATA